jgi:mannose-6-phosphate isomerase-like protein (cupin superfamily)
VSSGDPTHEERPWGSFTILEDQDTHKVKRLVVKPGQRLSYQLHHKRAEHWVVVAGTATITLDDVVLEVSAGQAVEIPLEAKHRVENKGTDDLEFVEVQTGSYFGEDDIVRFDDDYGRAATT